MQVVTEHSVMAVPRSLTAGGTYKRLPVTGHNRYTARADIITGSIIVTVAALLLVTETVFVIITATQPCSRLRSRPHKNGLVFGWREWAIFGWR